MVKVNRLVKRYGDLAAVDGISFTVEKGETVGLLGPNGAGKTTTMRILTCFMPATAGKAEVAGFDVFTQSLEVRRRIGYMPENVPLYPEMRVIEYLRYRGKLKGLRGQNLTNRIADVIDSCQLGPQRTRIIEQLSKGNRQRVGLAEALISNPELLVLDEPTIGLDPNQVRKVRDLIKEIGRDRTIILSTHILSEVEMMCERVIIMHNGRIAAEDTMENMRSGLKKEYICEVKAAPAELEAALSAIPTATDVRTERIGDWTRCALHSSDSQADLREAMFSAMRERNWQLRMLDVHTPSLEDVFVEITAR